MKSFTRAIGRLAATAGVFGVVVVASLGADARTPLLAPDFLDFAKPSDDPYVIDGDVLTHDRTNGVANAVGHAVVTRGGEILRADTVRVTFTNKMAYAEGNVTVTRGEDVLKCDRLRMDMSSNVAWAVGHVTLARDKDVWTGESLTYDFRTRRANVDTFVGSSPPFTVWAPQAEQKGSNVLVLKDAVLSTCTNDRDHLHFYIRAKTLTVTQGESVKISGATWYLGPIPVFYLPGWYRNMDSHLGVRVRAGYTSRWGGFLLTSFVTSPATWLESETHLDLRSLRGLGGGEDLTWHTEDNSARGMLSGYYANDIDPYDREDDPAIKHLDSQRYRLHLTHEWDVTDRDQLMLKGDYLSDTDVVEDFFDREFQRNRLPENYASITHRDDTYSAGLLYSQRLNDFYSIVNRKPEASFSVYRRALGDSGFYYEGDSSASMLEQTIAETVVGDPYRSGRVDADNRLYYPLHPFSGVSLVPRVGYRLTYYSETPPTGTGVVTTVTSGGAVLRRIPEYGMSASMRILRVWPDDERPYRHVVEPYADYTRLLDPSVLPSELYQFDDIDSLDKTHNVKVGIRNTLQTKREGDPFTLADVNLYTIVNLDPKPEEVAVDIFSLESTITPNDPLRVEVNVDYSRVLQTVQSVDARMSYDAKGSWLLDLDYLMRRDQYRVLRADAGMRFGSGWRALLFCRYEFDQGQMQEQGIAFRRAVDCMTFDLEVSQIPAYTLTDGTEMPVEWAVRFSLMFTAFPDVSLGARTGR